jgi:hypothetical protein
VINIKGDTLINLQFTRIQKFMKKTNLYFIVSKDDKFGAIDNKGRLVIRLEKEKSNQVKRELVKREVEHTNFDRLSREINYFKLK